MAVRVFDGVDDEVRFPIAADLTGAFTFAAVVKRSADGVWGAVIVNHDSGGTTRCSHEIGDTNLLSMDTRTGAGVLVGRASTLTLTVAMGWAITAVTKAAGTTVPRIHRYLFSGGGWVHEDCSGAAIGDPGTQAGGTIRLGEWADSDDLNGKEAVVAEWGSALTDGQVEALSKNLGTADWLNHSVAPAWVAEPGQNTPVVDLVGANDSTTINGTTIDSADDPAGWTFGTDVSMAAPVSFIRRI